LEGQKIGRDAACILRLAPSQYSSYDTGQGSKRLRTILGLNLVWLVAAAAVAQDRNFPAALGAGLPPLSSFSPGSRPPVGSYRGGGPRGPGYGRGYGRGYGPGGYGLGGYGLGEYGYAAPYQESPPVVNSVVVVQPPAVPAPPPEPIHSSIQNVKADSTPSASDAPPAFFVIALKNGSRLMASAVWVQGNEAHYVDADDQGRRVSLADVDRAATRELNQAHNLNLRLPPPASQPAAAQD